VITLDDAKQHLNITGDADDDLITAKIAAATAWCQEYVGFPDPANFPEPVNEAVRQLVAHLYENREASVVGINAQTLPFGVCELLSPYRTWVF
jgi:uncharacterized phage protein (predicted DNA packaging)